MKKAKSGHFCFLLNTLSPRRRSIRLSKLEARIVDYLIRLGEPLRLSVPANPVLFFSLPLILAIIHWINGGS